MAIYMEYSQRIRTCPNSEMMWSASGNIPKYFRYFSNTTFRVAVKSAD